MTTTDPITGEPLAQALIGVRNAPLAVQLTEYLRVIDGISAAILDNAQEEGKPVPAPIVENWANATNRITLRLWDAATTDLNGHSLPTFTFTEREVA